MEAALIWGNQYPHYVEDQVTDLVGVGRGGVFGVGVGMHGGTVC